MTKKVNDESGFDALNKSLKKLVGIHANERAELAEKISFLLRENSKLRTQIRELEAKCQSRNDISRLMVKSPENEFGLDFSLPEERE